MNLSRQKLDILDKVSEIDKLISKLKEDKRILLRGVDSIEEEGESMLDGRGLLPAAIQTIMKQSYNI